MRQDFSVAEGEKRVEITRQRKKKMELSAVIDDAEEAKGKRSGFPLDEFALGWRMACTSLRQRNEMQNC